MFIREHRKQFRISTMCRVLNASKGGFYAWLKRKPSQQKQRDQELRLKILAIHKESKKRYGSPRIHAALREENECCGRKRVARLMREERIAGKRRKRLSPRRPIPITRIPSPRTSSSARLIRR